MACSVQHKQWQPCWWAGVIPNLCLLAEAHLAPQAPDLPSTLRQTKWLADSLNQVSSHSTCVCHPDKCQKGFLAQCWQSDSAVSDIARQQLRHFLRMPSERES